MSKFCPILQRIVLYPECLECDEKMCRTENNMKNILESDEKCDQVRSDSPY